MSERDVSGKAWALGVTCLVALHLATRLHDLVSWVPLLNDEAIEVHRALLIVSDPGVLWLPNVELKPPLFYWLAAALVRVAPEPVLAVRLLSVLGGLASLALVLVIARRLWDRASALCAGAVLVASPLALLYERTGYVEPLLGALSLCALAIAVLPARSERKSWIRAGLLGVVLGVMLGMKQTAMMFAPFFVLHQALSPQRRDARAWARLALSFAVAGSFLSFVVLAPDVPSMWGKESATALGYHRSYVMPIADLLRLPVGQWSANAAGLSAALAELSTPVLLVATLLAIGWLLARRDRGAALTALWAVLPLAIVVARATRTEGRTYLVAFVAAPLAMLAGRGALDACRAARGKVVAQGFVAATIAIVAIAVVVRDAALLLRPRQAVRSLDAGPLARPDLSEERIADAAAALRELGRETPVIALVDLSFGMVGDGLAVELWGDPTVRVVFGWWVPDGQVPLVPDGSIDVHRSGHHRTLPPEKWSRETFQAPVRVFWVVNSLRWPAEAVQARAPGAALAFSLPASDGSAIDGWLVGPRQGQREYVK